MAPQRETVEILKDIIPNILMTKEQHRIHQQHKDIIKIDHSYVFIITQM